MFPFKTKFRLIKGPFETGFYCINFCGSLFINNRCGISQVCAPANLLSSVENYSVYIYIYVCCALSCNNRGIEGSGIFCCVRAETTSRGPAEQASHTRI
jgi:hypothetical protein